MNASFAQNTLVGHALRALQMLMLVTLLAACTTLPPPTAELDAAQGAVTRATAADADQHAATAIERARDALSRAQAAMASGDEEQARKLALAAAATADLAHARSQVAQAESDHAQLAAEIRGLQQRLELQSDVELAPLPPAPAATAGDGEGALVLRLDALDSDPQTRGLAAYERLRARQALDTLVAADSRLRADALYLAQIRVEIAELAARTGQVRRHIDALERQRSQLLVQASLQQAERARREAERLRIQAQIQAEEAARLRHAAAADSAALEVAEDVIQDVAGEQAARLAAAREREAELARQEAALLAGGTLPPSSRDARGEVFTLGGDAFAAGSANLTASAKASVQTLAAYLAGGDATILVQGHTDGAGQAQANLTLSQRRAEAVAAALAAAGVDAARIQASGHGEAEPVADNASAQGRARNRRVEVVVSAGG